MGVGFARWARLGRWRTGTEVLEIESAQVDTEPGLRRKDEPGARFPGVVNRGHITYRPEEQAADPDL